MGCCHSPPLVILRKKYGILQLDHHFLAKIQTQYLRRKRPEVEASMLQHSQRIFRQRMAEIEKKQQIVEARYDEPLRIARSNPQKASQSELRYNMTLEEIVGLEGVRQKFEELKAIVTKNVREVEQEMVEDIRMRFELIESKLREKIINVSLDEVKEDVVKQIEVDFKKTRAEQIKRYQIQVDQQISKRINFYNYTKRFITVVPQEQLMALAAQSKIPQQYRYVDSQQIVLPSQQKCCWCI